MIPVAAWFWLLHADPLFEYSSVLSSRTTCTVVFSHEESHALYEMRFSFIKQTVVNIALHTKAETQNPVSLHRAGKCLNEKLPTNLFLSFMDLTDHHDIPQNANIFSFGSCYSEICYHWMFMSTRKLEVPTLWIKRV